MLANLTQEADAKSKFTIHNHYKEKQKERRGSDSELVRNSKKYSDSNGIACDEKKRRLSQAEQLDEEKPPILGSTNIGTIAGLPQKPRKDKVKIKESFKKDTARNKMFAKSFGDKMQAKQVALPTAGEMNMEAKFKQGLLEGTAEKGVPRPPHRTEVVNHLTAETNNRTENVEKVSGFEGNYGCFFKNVIKLLIQVRTEFFVKCQSSFQSVKCQLSILFIFIITSNKK